MKAVYSHPLSMGPFCREVRKSEDMFQKCIACDQCGFEQCRKSGEICIYRCHMGLTEVVAPIMDRGALIGYLLFGQLLSSGSREYIEERIESLPFENKAYMKKLLAEIEITEERIIHASARLMAMCTSYVQLQKVLRAKGEGLSARLTDYIDEHLSEPLSVDVLCRALGASRGTIYTVSKNAFGMGVSDYIRSRRISAAIALLKVGELPIYKIAETVGITDANYLTKLIKKETGRTPKQIKNDPKGSCDKGLSQRR
jgi:ligand-binding sensor protein